MTSERSIIFFIVLLMAIPRIAADLYLPSLPAITQALQTNITNVQFSYSVFYSSAAIATLFYGPLADLCGRKPTLIMGIMLFGVMSLLAVFATSVTQLIAYRIFQGVGVIACSVIPRAMMRDHFSGKTLHKVSIYQLMTWSLTPVVIPIIGSYVQFYLGWQYNFVLLAVAAFSILTMTFFTKETLQEKNCRLDLIGTFRAYKTIITDKYYYPSLINAALFIGIFISFNAVAPVIIQENLHLSEIIYGWSMFTIATICFFGIPINALLMKFLKPSQVASIGVIVMFGGNLLLFGSLLFYKLNLLQFMIPNAIMLLGGLILYPTLVTKITQRFPDKAGQSSSIFYSVLFMGGALISCVISQFSHQTLLPMATFFFIILVIITYIHYFHNNESPPDKSD